MSIDKNYLKINNDYLAQNRSCNCCCNRNQQAYNSPYGIFSGIQNNNQTFDYNFYNPFGTMFSQWFNPFAFQFGSFNFQLPMIDFSKFTFPQLPMFNFPKFDMSLIPSSSFDTSFISSSTLGGKRIFDKVGYTSSGTSSQTKDLIKKEITNNDTNFKDILKKKGVEYNASVGHKVTEYAIDKALGKSNKDCALYVSDAFENTDNSIGGGHAFEKKSELEKRNQDFTKIEISSSKELTQLPAGSVVVYDKGVCGYHDEFGHVFIATGNGKGVSDFIQNNLHYPDNGKGISVYIPTKKSATV